MPATGKSVSFPITNVLFMRLERLRSGQVYCLSNGNDKWCFRPYYRRTFKDGSGTSIRVFATEVSDEQA